MKFRVFGDLHYSWNYKNHDKFDEKREKFFNHYFQTLFSQEADAYVSIGDLTNTGHPEEFKGVLDLIHKYDQTKAFQFTIGNHDSYIASKEEIQSSVRQDLYRLEDHGKISVIYLDTVRQQHVFDWSGIMNQDQLNWLDEALQARPDQTIIIFAHHPVYNTTILSEGDKNSIIPESPIMDILAKHKKTAFYICGHVHADSIVQIDNWTFVQIAAVLDQANIREIELTDHSFSINTQVIEEDFRQTAAWLGSRMELFVLEDTGYQGEDNRNIEMSF